MADACTKYSGRKACMLLLYSPTHRLHMLTVPVLTTQDSITWKALLFGLMTPLAKGLHP